MTDNQGCEFCNKVGLPIFPVRYAVVRDDVNDSYLAPELPEELASAVSALPLPEGQRYALRLLRPGYLYVLNVARGAWSAYTVDEKGYLFPFVEELKQSAVRDMDPDRSDEPVDRFLSPPVIAPTFNCNGNASHAAPARCIVIPSADQASEIRLVFTHTAWTKRVWKAYAQSGSDAYRSMQRLSLAQWRGGAAEQSVRMADHIASLVESHHPGDVSTHLANQTLQSPYMGSGVSAFNNHAMHHSTVIGHSTSPFSTLAGQVSGLSSWALEQENNLGIPPVLLAVNDPIGLTMELNELNEERVRQWSVEPTRKEKYESALTIRSLKQAIISGGEISELEKRQVLAGAGDSILRVIGGRSYRALAGGKDEVIERAGRYVDDEDRYRSHDEAWEKYKEMYAHEEHERYLTEDHPREVAAFDEEILSPVDRVFIGWLNDQSLKDHFQHGYDCEDIESGQAYTETLRLLFGESCGRTEVAQFLDDALGMDPASPSAFVLRALLLNQEAAIDQWMALTIEAGDSDSSSEFNWTVFAARLYQGVEKAYKENGAISTHRYWRASADFLHGLAGPLLRRIGSLMDAATTKAMSMLPDRHLVALMGSVAQAGNPNIRLVDMRTEMTRGQASRMLAGMLHGLSGADEQGLRSGARMFLDAHVDYPDARRYAFNGFVLVDAAEAERLNALAARQQRFERHAHINGAVLVEVDEFSQRMQTTARNLINTDVKVGLVGVMLSGAALFSSGRTMYAAGSVSGRQRTEFFSGASALTGGALEVTGNVIRNTAWGNQPLRRAPSLTIKAGLQLTRFSAISLAGRALTVVASVVGAAIAVMDGIREWRFNPFYTIGMMVLAVTLIVLAFNFGIAGFVGALLVSLVMAIVGLFKTSDLERWLDKTLHFGHGRNGLFSNVNEQWRALEEISKAD